MNKHRGNKYHYDLDRTIGDDPYGTNHRPWLVITIYIMKGLLMTILFGMVMTTCSFFFAPIVLAADDGTRTPVTKCTFLWKRGKSGNGFSIDIDKKDMFICENVLDVVEKNPLTCFVIAKGKFLKPASKDECSAPTPSMLLIGNEWYRLWLGIELNVHIAWDSMPDGGKLDMSTPTGPPVMLHTVDWRVDLNHEVRTLQGDLETQQLQLDIEAGHRRYEAERMREEAQRRFDDELRRAMLQIEKHRFEIEKRMYARPGY
ncbi:MAG: hypothetical protein MN733_10750 [Nitrososphaera sp.]|nr:hypothetical protein [Nitrososphaera sp.]